MGSFFSFADDRLYQQAMDQGLIDPVIEAARLQAGATGLHPWRFLISRYAFWESAQRAIGFYLDQGGDPFNRMPPDEKAHDMAHGNHASTGHPPSEQMCRAILIHFPAFWQLAVQTNAAPIVRAFFTREPDVARSEVDWEGLRAWDWACRANAPDSLAVLRELGFGPEAEWSKEPETPGPRAGMRTRFF